LREQILAADLVIGGVLIPGAAAPKLISAEMVKQMQPGSVLVDGNRLPHLADCCGRAEAVVKGDALIAAISAASILAKEARDSLMPALERAYPGYQLTDCKGYPTPGHLEALTRLGPSPVHRVSFEPVRRVTITIHT
jgi:ribonuclease HII